MDDGARLYDLFLALFATDRELTRFLVLHGYPVAELVGPPTKTASRTETAYEVARSLDRRGLVDRRLFEALLGRAPERADDIRRVAAFYRIDLGEVGAMPDAAGPVGADRPPEPEPPEPEPSEPEPPEPSTAAPGAAPDRPTTAGPPNAAPDVPPEVADYLQRLDAALDGVGAPPSPEKLAIADDRWAWAAAAAVFGSFPPTRLRPIGGVETPYRNAVAALSEVAFESFDGRWVLEDAPRRATLGRLAELGAWDAALAANADLPDDRRDLVRDLLAGQTPPLARLDGRRLEDLAAVAGWLEPLGVGLMVDRSRIAAAIERRSIIDPLASLVGETFTGRAEELGKIHGFIDSSGPRDPLVVVGPGGSGKSTLVGKILFDLEELAQGDPLSYAYVDFDKARHDPRDEVGLLEQIARQLRLLYATRELAETEFAALEAAYAGTDAARASDILALPAELDLDALVAELGHRLVGLASGGSGERPALVLVFDTFEEVQLRGPGAIHDALDLVTRLAAAIPGIRVIVAGRSPVPELGPEVAERAVVLGDLDPVAADALLERLDVRSPGMRRLIVTRFGGNPLTLHLAAEALHRIGRADDAFDGVVAQAGALSEVAVGQIQGMLYSRILGHINDVEIARMAHPGLVVRRVTVPVIREVLAGPCKVDPDHAEAIFGRLRAQITMFDADGVDALRHRQDVRRLMLAAMANDPTRQPTIRAIHDLAVTFHADRDDPGSKAEELYHRLMRGDDPRGLGRLLDAAPAGALASAVDEPMPAAAKRWLARRLGLLPLTDGDEWDQEDWEAAAGQQARSWLASRDPARALEVLAGREARLPGSELYAIESQARLAADDVDGAAAALETGLAGIVDQTEPRAQLELVAVAIEVRARQADVAGIVEATGAAASLADSTGQPARAIDLLSHGIAAAIEVAGEDVPVAGLDELRADLARRFDGFSRSDMRARPDAVREILRTVGPSDSGVLLHAALEAGDETDPVRGIFRDDPFVVERLLAHASPQARASMDALAHDVGLVGVGWKPEDLASRAVRLGRVGRAVAVVLENPTDDRAARRFIASDLVMPPGSVLS